MDLSTLPELWTTEQTAAFLQLEPTTMAQWRVSGKGPSFIKLGGRVRYYKTEILDWLEKDEKVNIAAPKFDRRAV